MLWEGVGVSSWLPIRSCSFSHSGLIGPLHVHTEIYLLLIIVVNFAFQFHVLTLLKSYQFQRPKPRVHLQSHTLVKNIFFYFNAMSGKTITKKFEYIVVIGSVVLLDNTIHVEVDHCNVLEILRKIHSLSIWWRSIRMIICNMTADIS